MCSPKVKKGFWSLVLHLTSSTSETHPSYSCACKFMSFSCLSCLWHARCRQNSIMLHTSADQLFRFSFAGYLGQIIWHLNLETHGCASYQWSGVLSQASVLTELCAGLASTVLSVLLPELELASGEPSLCVASVAVERQTSKKQCSKQHESETISMAS